MLDYRLCRVPLLQQLTPFENVVDLIVQLSSPTDAFRQMVRSLVWEVLPLVVVGSVHYAVFVLEKTTARNVGVLCKLLVVVVFLSEEADEEAGEVREVGQCLESQVNLECLVKSFEVIQDVLLDFNVFESFSLLLYDAIVGLALLHEVTAFWVLLSQ